MAMDRNLSNATFYAENSDDDALIDNEWHELPSSRPNKPIISANRYILRLREAFVESDVDQTGSLTYDQWMHSAIRRYIQDGKITDDAYSHYFARIDANADGVITWEELVYYLMKEMTSSDLRLEELSESFIRKANSRVPLRRESHRNMVLKSGVSPRTNEYVTLSDDAICFWNPSDLAFTRSFTEPGFYVDFMIFDHPMVLATVTTKRRLLFYDLDSFVQLPVEMSASPSPGKIKRMSADDADVALKVLEGSDLPMFNIPTGICYVKQIRVDMDVAQIFGVSDDQGLLELYRMEAPRRRMGTDYQIERVLRHRLHDGAITQLLDVPTMGCQVTSSTDGTILFFSYDARANEINIVRTLSDSIPIMGFFFSVAQKALITYGVSRDCYVWSLSPLKKIFRLGGHYNQVIAVTDFVTSTGDKYFVTMTNRKEFRLWDSVNYRQVFEWSDPVIQRPENSYSSIMFDYHRHALITSSSYPSKWSEDVTAHLEQFEVLTHNHHIIGCHYAKEFEQLLTVDAIGTFKLWNYKNGSLYSEHPSRLEGAGCELTACCLDCSTRRLLTASLNGEIIVWNFNAGTEMVSLNFQSTSPVIAVLACVRIGTRDYLIRAGWDKILTIYAESRKGEFDLYRSFVAHKADISAAVGHARGFVSAGINGQVISWVDDTLSPQGIAQLPPVGDTARSVESLVTVGPFVFAGDSLGGIHVFGLPRLGAIASLSAHCIVTRHAISALAADENSGLLFSGDTLGYVKKWRISVQPKFSFEPVTIVRCHQDEISALVLVNQGRFLVTCSSDRCVRLWQTEGMRYVGFFGSDKRWDIDNEATWSTEIVCEPDPIHFTVPQAASAPQRSQRPSVKARRADPADIYFSDQADEEPFNLQEARHVIEEYTQLWPGVMKPLPQPEDLRPRAPIPQRTAGLQETIRPSELIDELDTLMTRPHKVVDPASLNRLTALKNSLVRQKPKVPVKPKNAQTLDRVPLTLTFA
jgi:WD40 repeat protein